MLQFNLKFEVSALWQHNRLILNWHLHLFINKKENKRRRSIFTCIEKYRKWWQFWNVFSNISRALHTSKNKRFNVCDEQEEKEERKMWTSNEKRTHKHRRLCVVYTSRVYRNTRCCVAFACCFGVIINKSKHKQENKRRRLTTTHFICNFVFKSKSIWITFRFSIVSPKWILFKKIICWWNEKLCWRF